MKLHWEHPVDQLERLLLLRILSGEFAGDRRMPAQPVLAREYGVSRNTVASALGRLASRGLCVSVRGIGTEASELIRVIDPRLLVDVIQHAKDTVQALRILSQLLKMLTDILKVAAGEAALQRSALHVRALDEVMEAELRMGAEGSGPSDDQAQSLIEYRLWRIVAGASGNIATTATLNSLRPLWLDAAIWRGASLSSDGSARRTLAIAIKALDAASAEGAADSLLRFREEAIQRRIRALGETGPPVAAGKAQGSDSLA